MRFDTLGGTPFVARRKNKAREMVFVAGTFDETNKLMWLKYNCFRSLTVRLLPIPEKWPKI